MTLIVYLFKSLLFLFERIRECTEDVGVLAIGNQFVIGVKLKII